MVGLVRTEANLAWITEPVDFQEEDSIQNRVEGSDVVIHSAIANDLSKPTQDRPYGLDSLAGMTSRVAPVAVDVGTLHLAQKPDPKFQ